jgi:hypothetical protein
VNKAEMALVALGFSVLTFGMSYCIWWVARLRKSFEEAFAGLDNKENLAETITAYFKKIGASEKRLQQIHKSYEHLTTIAAKSLQKVAIVRFNPFRDTGSNQSFVLALLDNHDSGLLLTSIHSREGTRVYIKSIEYGSSKHQLSNEETEALKQAKSGKS